MVARLLRATVDWLTQGWLGGGWDIAETKTNLG